MINFKLFKTFSINLNEFCCKISLTFPDYILYIYIYSGMGKILEEKYLDASL